MKLLRSFGEASAIDKITRWRRINFTLKTTTIEDLNPPKFYYCPRVRCIDRTYLVRVVCNPLCHCCSFCTKMSNASHHRAVDSRSVALQSSVDDKICDKRRIWDQLDISWAYSRWILSCRWIYQCWNADHRNNNRKQTLFSSLSVPTSPDIDK